MRAFVVDNNHSLEGIKPIELSQPVPKSNEVLVAVKGSSINPADYKVATASGSWKFIHSANKPVQFGFDFSGVIEKTGSAVSDFTVGDEVYGFLPYSSSTKQGTYSDFITIKGKEIAKRPVSISHTEAGTLPTVAATAYQVLFDIAKFKKGGKILINGASGGVGIYLVQLAKNLFQSEVWGIAGSGSLDFIKEIGVDKAIDYNTTSIRDLDEKFDLIVDVVSNSSFGECKKLLNPKGTYVILIANRHFVTGLISAMVSTKYCKMIIVMGKNRTLSKITELVDSQQLKVITHSIYPIDKISDAFSEFIKGGVHGKIGISVSDF